MAGRTPGPRRQALRHRRRHQRDPALPDRSGTAGRLTASSGRKETPMPAKSAAQQKAAGAALSAKRGDTPKSELKGASKSIYESMTEKELDEMASTKRKGKPE